MMQSPPANSLNVAGPAKGSLPSVNVPAAFDLLGIDSIKKELQKLSATNQELLRAFQERPELPPARPKEYGSSGNFVLPRDADDIANYKNENERFKKEIEQLRGCIAVLEGRLRADAPTAVKELQEEFEQVLNEKTETIRALHMQNQELQEALRGGPDAPSPEQLAARQAGLEQLQLRLRQDEESLKLQAREMEMAMAKERADLARQRSEIQRLQADVQREVELASRDPGLRDRLANLQRRPDGRPRSTATLGDINLGAAPAANGARRPATMAAIDLNAEAMDASHTKSGFFRKLFGG
jgi:DNA repair exonuclease SbcCD ATPase subunit